MNNSTMDPNSTLELGELHFPDRIAIIASYTLVSLIALIGNAVVIFSILYFRTLRSPTNLLIVNLALADILMALFCIPFSYWPILILQYWPFGAFLCKFLSFTKAATVYLSSYTLIAISFDRFFAVVFPFTRALRMRHKGALVVIGIVWFIALAMAGPTLLLTEAKGNPTNCEEAWSDEATTIYSYSMLVLQYFFPLLVLIVTYTAIVGNIWRTRVSRRDKGAITQKSELRERKDSVKKMIPMMILVTSLYGLCWFPLNLLMNILIPIYPRLPDHPYILYLWWACHFCAMSHSMVNPIIYCARNQKFRDDTHITSDFETLSIQVYVRKGGVHFSWKHLRRNSLFSDFASRDVTVVDNADQLSSARDTQDSASTNKRNRLVRGLAMSEATSEHSLSLLRSDNLKASNEGRRFRGGSECLILEGQDGAFSDNRKCISDENVTQI